MNTQLKYKYDLINRYLKIGDLYYLGYLVSEVRERENHLEIRGQLRRDEMTQWVAVNASPTYNGEPIWQIMNLAPEYSTAPVKLKEDFSAWDSQIGDICYLNTKCQYIDSTFPEGTAVIFFGYNVKTTVINGDTEYAEPVFRFPDGTFRGLMRKQILVPLT